MIITFLSILCASDKHNNELHIYYTCSVYTQNSIYTLLMMLRVRVANSSFIGTCLWPSASGLSLSRTWSTHSLKEGIRPLR